jgi:superfamily II DNA/RNA helicase
VLWWVEIDVIAQSQSGTGKTTIFCVGVLAMIATKSKETQALCLSPTRELAVQSRNVIFPHLPTTSLTSDHIIKVFTQSIDI